MATKSEIENFQARNLKGLNKLAKMVGYSDDMCNTAFENFIDDNPGAIECLVEWVAENLGEDEDEDDCENEDESSDEANP